MEPHQNCVAASCRDWAMRQEALIILQELCKCMGKSLATELPSVLEHVWLLCESAPAVFQLVVIANEQDILDEVEGVSFETLVEQMFEFFLTVLGSKETSGRRSPAAGLLAVLDKLVYHTITFMQVLLAPNFGRLFLLFLALVRCILSPDRFAVHVERSEVP
jgi:hypothetical protein